jgi:hypothetical protein
MDLYGSRPHPNIPDWSIESLVFPETPHLLLKTHWMRKPSLLTISSKGFEKEARREDARRMQLRLSLWVRPKWPLFLKYRTIVDQGSNREHI